MQKTVLYLEEELGLEVNSEKSQVAPIRNMSFLGFSILRGRIRVSTKAQLKFKARVRELTRRKNPLSMYQVIHQLNIYLRGWVGYFGIQEFKYLFRDLDPTEAKLVWVNMRRWRSTLRTPVRFVMSLEWFRERDLEFLHDHTLAFSRS